MSTVRPPAVAGLFYPADPIALQHYVQAALSREASLSCEPKALIVPHAGYVYSGQTAAAAYATLKPYSSKIRRVVLLGPTHRVAATGLVLPEATRFSSPLGSVKVDSDAVSHLLQLPQVSISAAVHAEEHALEVQLPFLQNVLDEFLLLPLLVGDARCEDVAEVLDLLWGGDETLIVISSDMSHYLPYSVATRQDQQTSKRILSLSSPISHEEACGGTAIGGLLISAKRHGLQAQLLAHCNSGDTAGTRDSVVGYASYAFTASHDDR